MFAMSTFMQELAAIATRHFPDDADITIDPDTHQRIRVSWKTNDDPSRSSKRVQPIIIELHEDFLNITNPPDHVSPEIGEEFSAFIRKKRAQFKPRTTEEPNQTHTPDKWIFPPTC
jgi:hypothetical protein